MVENYPDWQNAYVSSGWLKHAKETRATLTNDRVCTHREEYKQQG